MSNRGSSLHPITIIHLSLKESKQMYVKVVPHNIKRLQSSLNTTTLSPTSLLKSFSLRKMNNYMLFINRLLVHSLLLLCFATLAFGANRLLADEVQALKDIAKTLGKTDWNFSADPCSGQYGWITHKPDKYFANNVTCGNCTTSDAANATSTDQICHVVSILLKSQDLQGTLPLELVRLHYLQTIDLTRNFLNGTIPPQWGTLPLVHISLGGNRLTGSIPVELANITTMKILTIDVNYFSGGLPWELGNLPHIELLGLTSNNFTGELPSTFARLATLKEFRIMDNSFSGEIPNFIQNWTNIEKLWIQASGLTGPIPSGISLLTNLIDLRIADLNGPESSFPLLENMKYLRTLILRTCNINGQLPVYFSDMTELATLDLSFNKLTGRVPSNFVAPNKLDYIFLTGNLLNGSEPELVADNIDLSYNNFTEGIENCQPQAGRNFFASASKGNDSAAVSCLNNLTATCLKSWHSLNINCGGSGVTINGTTYDEDTVANGPSSYYLSSTNWALSSTGYFLDDDSSTDHFTWSADSSTLSMANRQLYTTARLSPISLTYYGFCLLNGNYTVNLHFAEIMFTNGPTYKSLGRRIFDVYIQGIRVLQDFNIAKEAGGAGKAVVKNFTAAVTTNTLEIRFFWAGKGTTGIPVRSIYGPLVSAISVDPDFEPPAETSSEPMSRSLSVGEVVGIMAGGIFLVLLIFGILWLRGYLRRERTLEQDLKGLDLQTGKFSLRQIKDATNNFDRANKIGEGGFGPVFKGQLSDGTAIAVKQLSAKSKQGNREFLNEIGMISALQHPHLVKLYGCCIEGNQLLLVYEYMENNNVGRALFGAKESQLKLDWPTRHRICVGIAKGLAYLHEESRLKIVHRDIKAANVLLDKNLYPKISDFGLAKLNEDDSTHISTRIAGTYGYMAPEYAMRGHLTNKADVYSFGILVLEMVSGRCNTTYCSKGECFYILDWALLLKQKGSLLDLVDPRLGSDFNKEDVMITINVALLCCNVSAALRPAMSSVVSMLEGRAPVEVLVLDSCDSSDEISEMRKHFESIYSLETIGESSQRQTMSIEGGCTSPTSVQDHCPINPHSDYWENRN